MTEFLAFTLPVCCLVQIDENFSVLSPFPPNSSIYEALKYMRKHNTNKNETSGWGALLLEQGQVLNSRSEKRCSQVPQTCPSSRKGQRRDDKG